MTDTLNGLYEVIQERRTHPQEGSYTCYLFEKGPALSSAGADGESESLTRAGRTDSGGTQAKDRQSQAISPK